MPLRHWRRSFGHCRSLGRRRNSLWRGWVSIEVTETAKVDEQEVEGSATKPKQATGYEDAKVNIELIIDDTESQTKYERCATPKAPGWQ